MPLFHYNYVLLTKPYMDQAQTRNSAFVELLEAQKAFFFDIL